MLDFDPFFRRVRPLPSPPDPVSTLLKVLSFASGDGKSGVSARTSAPGRFDLEPEDRCFFFLLSDELDAVLPFLLTVASSSSTVGVGLRDDPADVLPRRTLPLLVRL